MTVVLNENYFLADAEVAIQKILLELEDELLSFGKTIDFVNVDTRNFAGLKTEIITIVKVG
jgi:hypothetical protein